MSRPVKKTLHPAVDSSRREAPRFEELQNILMNLFAVHSVANLIVADLLPGLHGRIDLFEFVRRAPAHDSAAQVAEIAVVLRARKNIEDDRSIGFDRSAAFVMRIDALVAG